MRQRVAALHLGEVAHVVGHGGRGVGQGLGIGRIRRAARGGGTQHAQIDVVEFGGVDGGTGFIAHLYLVPAEEGGELLQLVLNRLVDFGVRIGEQHGDLEVAQLLLFRARQGELPAAAVDFVGAGDRVHGDLEVLGAARQRSDHGDVADTDAVARVALVGDHAPGRLVAVDAAVMRGISDRGADVAARIDAGQAGGERRARAAG